MVETKTKSRRSKIFLIASLLVVACVGFVREYQCVTAEQSGYDFVPVYVASHAFWNGVNPYDDTRLKEHSAELLGDGDRYSVGLPYFPFVYPPSILLVLGPLCLLKLSHAWGLWFCINFTSLILLNLFACRLITRRFLSWHTVIILAGCLVFPPVRAALASGQSSLLVSLMIVLSLYSASVKRTFLAALFMCIASIKPQFVLVFAILLSVQNRHFLMYYLALTAMVNLIPISMIGVYPFEKEYLYLTNMSFGEEGVNYFGSPFSSYNFVCIHPLLTRIFGFKEVWKAVVAKYISVMIVLIPAVVVYVRKIRKVSISKTALAFPLTVLCFYHRNYDAVLLIPLAYIAAHILKGKNLLAAASLFLLLIANRFDLYLGAENFRGYYSNHAFQVFILSFDIWVILFLYVVFLLNCLAENKAVLSVDVGP